MKRKLNENSIDEMAKVRLFDACVEGDLKQIKKAIRQKTNLNIVDAWNQTLLHVACVNGHVEIAETLINQNINLEPIDHWCRTPFYSACCIADNDHNAIQIIRLLASKGVDINSRDNHGCTAFFKICETRGKMKIFRELILQKVHIEALDHYGYTPFHIACRRGNIEIVRELIKLGVDIKKPDNKNRSPFYTACANGLDDVVQELSNHVNISEIVAHLFKQNRKVNAVLFAKIKEEYVKIMHLLLFGQKQPESPLSVIHRDLLQDIQKVIKEKTFL